MEKAWFKQALRKAGKTSNDLADAIGRDRAVVSRIMNGHQRITIDQAKVFAAQLGVPLDEILMRSGLADPPTAQVFKPGFADGDATPFVHKGPEDRATPTIAQALGARPGVDIWTIRSGALALMGYMPGDHMLVDTLQADRAAPGDVVVAQVYDNARGTAATLLRRFEPPVLVAASTAPEDRRVHVVDGNNVVIRGKVVASWRAA
ncbi:helix-turn-helix transcriptional regulator [Paenirhodobacter sp. CAU 1674]|uniref:LexA family transcriptional regulator n=1 Tax=Paenirhodobacter sp. CAU 1674 TaxID=3032596 RepID=UPI0023DC641F|nr:helix-turn-helix transcriptional regulator [Paenirhodobacter sp. CAU 1674]MDF2143229.1 helix-turn-helix transcriptional regulator [Paenirhodobacter sp. CAU 1674]